jgi:hypothetical protein
MPSIERKDPFMNHEEAMAKAVKLLRLATSTNPNEAALAASRAQEIIDRYKLGALSLDYDGSAAQEPIKDFGFDPLDPESKQHATWRSRLASCIAKNNQCKIYLHGGRGTLGIIGRPSDVSAVRYLFSWMLREVETLTKRDCTGCGRTYANNYRIGVVETVAKRLHEQHLETQAAVKAEAAADTANPMALVRVQNAITKLDKQLAELDVWSKKNMRLRSSSSSRSTFDPSARDAGRAAGHEVRIRPTKSTIQSSAMQVALL